MTIRFTETPSAEHYVDAMKEIFPTDTQLQMLRLHYFAPMQTITSKQMAVSLGFAHYGTVNLLYGQLGKTLGEKLGYNPMKERLGAIITFEKRDDEWYWIMRPQLANALETLGLVNIDATMTFAEEVAEDETRRFVEGSVTRVSVNAYERNPQARRECIKTHGQSCCICGVNFGERYGVVAEGYIHVHHLRSLSDIQEKYEVDPINDLRPVCPNCHAVIHLRKPAYSIEEVRDIINIKGIDFKP